MAVLDRIFCHFLGFFYDLTAGKFPATINIETTNICNASCTICPHSQMTRPKGIMEEALYRRVIDECAAQGCESVHLHNFGEPLFDPALSKRIAYAKGKGIRSVKIFTNASLLHGQKAQDLLESGIDEIKVSIDGADREEFESIRRGLSYEKVTSNIKRFVSLRNERHQRTPRVIVACSTTSSMRRSMDNLKTVVDEYDFGRLHNWGGQMESKKRRLRKPCTRVWRTFTILWNGDVALCCLDFEGEVKLGNMNQASMTGIWKSPGYAKVKNDHRAGSQHQVPICRKCSKSFLW